jgi:hypothetical protein
MLKATTTYEGTAALGCPAERSSATFVLLTMRRASLDQDSRGRLSPRGLG